MRSPNIIVAIFQLLLFSTLFLSLPYWSPARNVQAVGSPDFSIALSPSFVVYPQDTSQLSSSIILTSENGFNGVVDLNFYWYNGSSDIFISLNNPYLPNDGSATETVKIFSPPLPSTGCCGILGVTGSTASLSHSANLTIAIPLGPDFALSRDFPSIKVPPGTAGASAITVTSIDNVDGRVFFAPAVPQNSTFSGGWNFEVDEAWLVAGSTSSVEFQVYPAADVAPGSYIFKITGSSFSHSHSINVTVVVFPFTPVGDFGLTVSPDTLTMHSDMNSNATISLHSYGGFHGFVRILVLEITQCCTGPITNDPFGPTALPSPTLVMVPMDGLGNSTLRVETPRLLLHGNYTIKVSATSGNSYHLFNVTITVPPVQNLFTIESDPASISVVSGKSASTTLMIRSSHGYAGTVNLSTTVSSGLIQARVSSEVVKLQPQVQNQYIIGSLATANLTISSYSSAPSGTYTITVRGTAGAYMYTDYATVKVISSAQPSTSTSSSTGNIIFSLPITVFYGTIAALVISAAVAVSLLVWSSRGKKDPSMATI